MGMRMLRTSVWVGGFVAMAVLFTQPWLQPHVARFFRAPWDLSRAVYSGITMLSVEREIQEYYEFHNNYPPEPWVECLLRGQKPSLQPDPRREQVLDPWGSPYQYLRRHNPEGYEIVCLGPDGILRTRDDVRIGVIHGPPPAPQPPPRLRASR